MDGVGPNEWSKMFDEKLMVRNSNKEHLKSAINFTHHQISSCLVPPPAVQSSLFGMLPLCTIGLVTAFDKEVGLAMLL